MTKRIFIALLLLWVACIALLFGLKYAKGAKPKYIFEYQTQVPDIPCDHAKDVFDNTVEKLNKYRRNTLKQFDVSLSEQVAFGKGFHKNMNPQPGFVEDRRLAKLQAIADKMQPYTVSGLKYTVFITDESYINAYTIAGGKIYFTKGILAIMENEAEWAMIMGHEIGHNENNHCTKSLQKLKDWEKWADRWQLLDYKISEIAVSLENWLTISFNQPDETSADLCGVYLTDKAGYDPEIGKGIFEKFIDMERGENRGLIDRMWRSHPFSDKRLACIEEYLAIAKDKAEKSDMIYPSIEHVACSIQWLLGILLGIPFLIALFFVFTSPSNILSVSILVLFAISLIWFGRLSCIDLIPRFAPSGKKSKDENTIVVNKTAMVKTRRDRLILRKEPKQKSAVVDRMEKGTHVFCHECGWDDVVTYEDGRKEKGRWCRVTYNGQEGYAWGWLLWVMED